MRKDVDLDQKLTQAFKNEAEKIQTDDRLKEKIDRQILNIANMEDEKMSLKKFSLKKKIALAVVCMGALSTCLYAATKIVSWGSSVNINEMETNYDHLEEQEKELGYKVDIVKEFSNGYAFERMDVTDVNGYDEQGKVIDTYKQFTAEYKNKEEQYVTLDASKGTADEPFRKPKQKAEKQGIQLYYYLDTYKTVPPSYKMTEEDKENEKKDDYCISVGSDKVEVFQIASVQWIKDDVEYTMTIIKPTMNADEILKMAEEMIQ